ncbi:HAD family hydrolase [Synechococcus sp. BA-132 BA5]|uniref:HAD family hydrolase n=1 Tax=Synechococcus sp. BA-132 BA5 TaxID=3110252 RepID=UPI002B21FD62|nr:HAD family hydrolase [Synechococcus sp. BA-132 BA5]MEA5415014.1 HAD family hydrolase [Synechococcus sp. BA-132 BA5]
MSLSRRRRWFLLLLGGLVAAVLLTGVAGWAGTAARPADPLPSWNPGAARDGILRFVRQTTDPASPRFVPPAERIATFDQDGTLWVEQPVYPQVRFILERVPGAVTTREELERLAATALSGMPLETFRADVRQWLARARHPRWQRPYTELTYQPMQELLRYLRAHDYKTYIVTGGGQDFVRVYAEQVYGIPPEQVIGSAGATRYGYDSQGRPFLTKEPRLLLNDNDAGKPEGIQLMIGRRPIAAFGNSTGDRQMLEYTEAGDGSRLAMLVLHDDARREYAYGPALGLPDTRVGRFTQELHDQALQQGWTVISMKNDWKRIFPFDS